MKAQFGIKWTLLMLIVTVIIIVAVMSPYQKALAESIRTSAYFHATEIAGIINLLQTSPNMTIYTYNLPDMMCSIIIGEDVNVTVLSGSGGSYVVDTIKSDVKVVPVERDCTDAVIVFSRIDDRIEIS